MISLGPYSYFRPIAPTPIVKPNRITGVGRMKCRGTDKVAKNEHKHKHKKRKMQKQSRRRNRK